MHEGPRFLLLWNWTWLSVATLRGHQPGRPAKQSNQSSLAQDSNPESTVPLGNCSDFNIYITGEDKRPCGRRDRYIFPKCIARSSPGKNFSFIFISLQNKQGKDKQESIRVLREICLLHCQQMKHSHLSDWLSLTCKDGRWMRKVQKQFQTNCVSS